jgi:peptide/nickel transport system substrate-binding protein
MNSMIARPGRFTLLVALLVAALVPAFFGSAMAQKRGGTLVYMIPASGAPSLDGHRETTFATVHATAPFYSLLIRVDPKSKLGKEIAGDLATGWTVSKDKLTYTFKIEKGVRFHDGSNLTSKDVLASWNHIVFPPEGVLSPRQAMFAMVESISAPDSETIVFKLKFASGAFLPALAIPFNYIYSAALLEKDPHYYETNVMGSGPFKLVQYTPGNKITGERFTDYHKKGLPYLDGIEAIYAPKQNVQVQAIRGGRAHSMFRGLPPAARDDLVNAMGNGVSTQESTWNCALLFSPNSYRKPWDDVRARRALSLALDRWGGSHYLSRIGIVKTVGGAVFPGHPLAPSQTQLKSLEGFWPDVKKSRALARQLLKEAGVPEGYKFTMLNRNTDQPYKVVGTWLIDQFRQIGLNVDQEVVPTAQLYQRLRMPEGGDWEAAMHFNCQSLVNPTVDIAAYTSSSGQNYADFHDPVVDDLFGKQMREPDPAKQKVMMWKIQQAVTAQAATIPTLWWQRTVVYSSKMKFWQVTPSHYLNMQMESVWLDE